MKKTILFLALFAVQLLGFAVNITLQVNMSQQTVSPNGVHVAGSFQGWSPNTTLMTDPDGDGIYTVSLDVTGNMDHTYKFINGDAWTNNELVPSSCGWDDGFGGFNRLITVGNADGIVPVVCFGACENCPPPVVPGCTNINACNFNAAANSDDGSCLIIGNTCDDNNAQTNNDVVDVNCNCMGTMMTPTMVVLRVDMTNQTVDAAGVFVAGTFNNWDATATQLSEYQPGLYQGVLFAYPGETIQYKFLNGNTWLGTEIVPSTCGVDDGSGNINRTLSIGDVSITADLVCFNECAACIPIEMSSVTFQVDMSNTAINPNGVFVAGDFQGWVPNGSQMTNTFGNIYSYTASIPTGNTVYFKFINGGDWTQAENVDFACAFNDGSGNFNRGYNVVSGDNYIPIVCFGQCQGCATQVNQFENKNPRAFPNPFSNELNFTTPHPGVPYTIYNAWGQAVAKGMVNGKTTIDTSQWPNGLYWWVLVNGARYSVIKVSGC